MKRYFAVAVTVAALPALMAFVPADDSVREGRGDEPTRTVRTTASGMVVQTVKTGDVQVRTFGRSAPRVKVVDPKSSRGDVRGKTEVVLKVSDKQSREALAASGVGPTVYEMTLATGDFTAKQACEFAKGLGEYDCKTSTQVKREASSARRQALAPVYDSRCYNYRTYEGDGSKWSHNCNVRRVDSQTRRNIWISNQMKATAGEDDTGFAADGISGVGMRAEYSHSDSEAVDWEPSESRPYSACNDRTVTVQGRKGASYSSSSVVCDDLLAPWHSPAFQYFGSKWTGPEAPRNHTRSTIAASLHRVPKPGTRAYDIRAWIRWN